MKKSILSILFFLGLTSTTMAAELSDGYAVDLDPEKYTTAMTNPYFSASSGKQLIFEGETAKGEKRIEVTISGETKTIQGVETLVYTKSEYLNGEEIEVNTHYLAQDTEGNIWNFGREDVWMTGENGALPGMWITTEPTVGKIYRQEYAPNASEDQAEIVSSTKKVNTPSGTYTDCVKILTTSRLDASMEKYTTYCTEVGGPVVIEENGERMELVHVGKRDEESASKETPRVSGKNEPGNNWLPVTLFVGMLGLMIGMVGGITMEHRKK